MAPPQKRSTEAPDLALRLDFLDSTVACLPVADLWLSSFSAHDKTRRTGMTLFFLLCALPLVTPFRAPPTLAPSRLPAALHAARSSIVRCAAPEFIFELNEDRTSIKFGCRQKSVTMVKPEAGGSLQEFIGSRADAIVMSSWEPGQVSRVDGTDDEYVINVEEFNFVVLKFSVELRARCTLDKRTTTATLESLGFRLIGPGMERIADVIDIRVIGKLRQRIGIK